MRAPDPIAFTLFGMDVRWYGILIGLGFVLAIFLSYKRAPRYGIKEDHILDFALFLIPAAVIGARTYYVIFNWDYYGGDLTRMLDIRSGGLAIHGGLIAGILVAFAVCKYHHIRFADLTDVCFPTVALAQAIGRWGNFFNSEAHGGPTDLPWAIYVDGQYVHPTFLYESLWCFALFLFLVLFMDKRRTFSGQLALLYGILYSLERICVEQLRTDSLMIGPFKQAQVLSFCVIVICLALYIISKKRNRISS